MRGYGDEVMKSVILSEYCALCSMQYTSLQHQTSHHIRSLPLAVNSVF